MDCAHVRAEVGLNSRRLPPQRCGVGPVVKAPARQATFSFRNPKHSQRLVRKQSKLQRSSLIARSAGRDAVQGWIDVAKLVSGGGGVKSAYKDLAYQIGKDIYIDVNGWHLFLKDVTAAPDVKLNQALAQQIGEESSSGRLDLQALLKKIPIKIGGGRTKVSLYDAIPSFGYDDLESIVRDFERNS